MRQGESRSAQFQLRNRSKETLRISRVVGHCSCASHHLSDSELSPGETATLTLTYQSGGSRGDTGTFATIYYFLVEQQQLLNTDCQIKAHVQPNIVWTPEVITFQTGHSSSCRLNITPDALSKVTLLDVACTREGVMATIDSNRDPKTAQVTVLFDSELWGKKPGKAELILRVGDPDVPILRVPIRVTQANPQENAS